MGQNKKLAAWMAVLAWIAAVGPQVRGGDKKTFKGAIADTQCALNVHSMSQSHKEMIGMKAEIKTQADCVRYCVKERGGRYVLLVRDKVYKLDAQAAAEPWAGMKVRIVGTLDPKTETIVVLKIEALSADGDNSAY